MKIRYAKKILFSPLYEGLLSRNKEAYYDEKKKAWVVPARKDIILVIKATKRYAKWREGVIRAKLQFIQNNQDDKDKVFESGGSENAKESAQ